MDYRVEHDSMGEVRVPGDKYWGAQTQRSRENFPIGVGLETMPAEIIRAFGILKKAGYLVMDKDGYLSLTDSGLKIAQKIYERHTTLTEFLERLGVSPETAAKDACKIEHDISDETFEALKQHAHMHKRDG